jgi:colanic acid/amylovoran biosynthesis protein
MGDFPRILIVNLHSCRNIGDAAITEATIENFRRRFPEAKITLAANDPESHAGLDVDAVESSLSSYVRSLDRQRRWRWNVWRAPGVLARVAGEARLNRPGGDPAAPGETEGLSRLFAVYREADLVASCGGGIFTASHRWALGPFWSALTLAYGDMVGKPVYMLPQSVGPFATAIHRRAARFAYSRLRFITARDPISEAAAVALGTGRPCHLAPDIAFALKPAPAEMGARWLESQGVDLVHRPTIGITVLDWEARTRRTGDQASYEDAIRGLVRRLSSTLDAQTILFTQADGPSLPEDDRPVMRRIAGPLSDVRRLVMIESMPTAKALMSAYGHLDFLVGTRMHSGIFSAVAGTPFLAIGYLDKAQGTFGMMGLESQVQPIDALGNDALGMAFDRSWAARAEIRRRIQGRMAQHSAAAARAVDLIADDWLVWRSGHG